MKRLTRPLNSVRLRELLRSLSRRASFTKLRFSKATRPLPHAKHSTPSCPSKPLDFSTSASSANRPSFKPELPETDTEPAELDPPTVESFIHVENPNPNVVEASSDHNNIDDVSRTRSKGSESSVRRNADLHEELSKNVVHLSCKSSAEGGKCDVYLVGTLHISKESCREVEAVISYLKPQVVFLELCSSRVGVFNTRNVKDVKVPSVVEMVEMWRNKHNLFDILYIRFLAKIARMLEVVPGSELAYEEARKCGAKIILGDCPVHITCSRFSGKMTLGVTRKLLSSLCFQPAVSVEDLCRLLKDLEDDDKLIRMLQEINEEYPTLFETIVDDKLMYMSYTLLRAARKHSSVVGRGHLPGIRKYWKQPVPINELMTIPPQKSTLSNDKILAYLVIAVAFVSSVVFGIYLTSKK